MSSVANGVTIKQGTIDAAFLTGPGEDIVPKLLMQLASVPQFVGLFGPYVAGNQKQRWADYQRFDWSIRQLPAINVFESETEEKDSSQAFLNGTVAIQIYWPPNFRRSDLTRVPAAFKGALENFFESKSCQVMLDELYWIQRPMKVYGLNELGRRLSWVPDTEGLVENELVPVTLMNVRYKIDLRAWYRALEFMDRTKDQPFVPTLAPLAVMGGTYDGVTDPAAQHVEIVVNEEFTVSNP